MKPITKQQINDLKKHLTAKQRRRMQLAIWAESPLSQRQIARIEGVTQPAICQSIQGAIKKLKKIQKKIGGIT
jgi:DNA-directed RNA polymerase specialized sigma subunit